MPLSTVKKIPMLTNQLIVNLKTFNHAMKIFKVGMARKNAKKKPVILQAMLSFSNGFLSIESDDKVAVMHASGEWHGKAQFSNGIVKALALVPLNINPVMINYADGRLSIGTTSMACDWELASLGLIARTTNPSLIDVFAMWRTQPAEQLLAKGLTQQNKLAKAKLLKLTASAAKNLIEFEVTQNDLLKIIEAKVKAKLAV